MGEYESEYDLYCNKCNSPVNTPEYNDKYECNCTYSWGEDDSFPKYWEYREYKIDTSVRDEIPFA